MPALTRERLEALLHPYLGDDVGEAELPADLLDKLGVYLDLLLRWNARTNLTAVRDPEEMVRRHFGESLFAGLCLRKVIQKEATVLTTLLDLGSGAGFPGLPIQLLLPEWRVTLAESQGKKAAFLREVVRALELRTEVWGARVETMPSERLFDVVTMRAVDRMGAMVAVGAARVQAGGWLLQLVGADVPQDGDIPIPGRLGSFVRLGRDGSSVPRGT